MASIENFIFDFGQVLCEFKPYNMISPYAENVDDIKLLSDVVFDRVFWDRLDDGSESEDSVKPLMKAKLPERLHHTVDLVLDNWYYHLPIFDQMVKLIKRLKDRGKRIYLLSNISINFANNYIKVPQIAELLSLFDGCVFSAKIGMVKPRDEIFEFILNEFKIPANKCVFIDDAKVNVAAAEKNGIHSVLFKGNFAEISEYCLNL